MSFRKGGDCRRFTKLPVWVTCRLKYSFVLRLQTYKRKEMCNFAFFVANNIHYFKITSHVFYGFFSLKDRVKKLMTEKEALDSHLKNEKDEKELYKVTGIIGAQPCYQPAFAFG